MLRYCLLIAATAVALGGCSSYSGLQGANVATGDAAYKMVNTPQTQQRPVAATTMYRIAPRDSINVSVFQEPELSTPADKPLPVDSTGNISLPLVGTVAAVGRTSDELAVDIANRLRGRYLKNPFVTVTVASSAPQMVTVQGEVTQPGVFEMKSKTSLLEAISLARGETRLASTKEVALFRTVNGKRMGALFDVDAIRRGAAPDPEVLPDDVIIVGHSRGKQMWQDLLSVTPLFGVFRVVNGL